MSRFSAGAPLCDVNASVRTAAGTRRVSRTMNRCIPRRASRATVNHDAAADLTSLTAASTRLQSRAAVFPAGPVIRGERGDHVADPSEEPAGSDPHAGRDDQPEDAAQEVAVVELAEPWEDRAE